MKTETKFLISLILSLAWGYLAQSKLIYLKYNTFLQVLTGAEYHTYKTNGYIEQGNICLIYLSFMSIALLFTGIYLYKIIKANRSQKPPKE